MSFFSRLKAIFQAKASKALDAAENRTRCSTYSFEKQTELLTKVRRGVADVATSKKRLELQADKLQASIGKLEASGRGGAPGRPRGPGPHGARAQGRRPGPAREHHRAEGPAPDRAGQAGRRGAEADQRRSSRSGSTRRPSRPSTPPPRRRPRSARPSAASPRTWPTSAWRWTAPRTRSQTMRARAGAIDELLESGALTTSRWAATSSTASSRRSRRRAPSRPTSSASKARSARARRRRAGSRGARRDRARAGTRPVPSRRRRHGGWSRPRRRGRGGHRRRRRGPSRPPSAGLIDTIQRSATRCPTTSSSARTWSCPTATSRWPRRSRSRRGRRRGLIRLTTCRRRTPEGPTATPRPVRPPASPRGSPAGRRPLRRWPAAGPVARHADDHAGIGPASRRRLPSASRRSGSQVVVRSTVLTSRSSPRHQHHHHVAAGRRPDRTTMSRSVTTPTGRSASVAGRTGPA